MKTTRFAFAPATIVALGLSPLTPAARSDEEEIPLDGLPKAVSDAAKAKFPGARWREAAQEDEDGRTVSEVAMTHEGRRMDVAFRPDGALVLVETEAPEADLPGAVREVVRGKYPGAKIGLVESVKKGPELKGEVDFYELHLETEAGESVEIESDGSGKILETESGTDEGGRG